MTTLSKRSSILSKKSFLNSLINKARAVPHLKETFEKVFECVLPLQIKSPKNKSFLHLRLEYFIIEYLRLKAIKEEIRLSKVITEL